MADFPTIDFEPYQWATLDRNYIVKWNGKLVALNELQANIVAFGEAVEQELASTLQAAEQTRQQAINDTNAIKGTAVQAAGAATTKAGEAASSAAAALEYRNQAQQAVLEGVIADGQTSALTTWSSEKISAELGNIGAILDEINGEVS